MKMLIPGFRRACCCFGWIVTATIAGCGETSPTSATADAVDIRPAAAQNLLDLDGREFNLWDDASDPAATVLIFSRTDCPISNRYAPTVKKLHEAFYPKGVRFFLAYVDPSEDANDIRRHLTEYAYPCPAIRDPRHTLVESTGATVTPEAVLYNAKREQVYRGRIDNLYAAYGQARDKATTHDLSDAIEATLAGRTVDGPSTPAVGCPIADLQ
jgi:hypothetical protein